jgi:hypothetical protein
MNIKEQKLYSKFLSLPEGIEKGIAWARYHNYKRKPSFKGGVCEKNTCSNIKKNIECK